MNQITPRLSDHARQRCKEMGVSTKRAKRIVQDPDITRPATKGCKMALSDTEPEIAVVYKELRTYPLILTVVWRTYDTYDRSTYQPRAGARR